MKEVQQRKAQREEAILLSLKKFDYLSRSQLQRLHDLSGDRNARRVLGNLSAYLYSFPGENGEHIYYLNKAGRERVDCKVVRNKTGQAGHYLMRNDVFLHYHPDPDDWKNEVKISVEGVVAVIADAYFLHQRRRHFLEVDHLQHMTKNREKIDRYKKLQESGVFQERFKYFPRLVWVTLTENRKRKLQEWCSGLDVTVHLWSDIK